MTMTCRSHRRTSPGRGRPDAIRKRAPVIEDPRKPYRIRVGVAYRVVEVEGELVVRATSKGAPA